MSKPRTIRDQPHTLVLLKITGRDELGRPKQATILYDENVENLQGGEEYVTAWVPSKCVVKSSAN